MILAPTKANLELAAAVIANGNLVAFPTETVYGLGANAWNTSAVQSIYALKGRPAGHPLIAHIASFDQLDWVASRVGSKQLSWPEIESRLKALAVYWPGALSILLPKSSRLADAVCRGREFVAVRIPSHDVARALIELCGCPLAAPSANRFGRVSPTSAAHVESEFAGQDLMILDGGSCTLGLESTIVHISEVKIKVLRPGAVTFEQLQEALPGEGFELTYKSNVPVSESQPGLLEVHYRPGTPLISAKKLTPDKLTLRLGVIAFHADALLEIPSEARLVLSPRGDLAQVSAGFFSALRELDAMKLDAIIVDTCQETGIGWALVDRIARAMGNPPH